MLFRAVQFDNITSKFDSVASFCYRFVQLGTNCFLQKELPTSELPISSLVHMLNGNSVATTFYPILAYYRKLLIIQDSRDSYLHNTIPSLIYGNESWILQNKDI